MLTEEQVNLKRTYRQRYAEFYDLIPIRFFLTESGIEYGAFSRFMKGQDTAVSMKKLQALDKLIKERCIDILMRFYGFNF